MTAETMSKGNEVLDAGLTKAKEMIIAASEPVALATCAEAILKLSEAVINLEQAKKL